MIFHFDNISLNQINWQLQLDPSAFDKGFYCRDPPFFWITARTDYSNTYFSPYRVKALHYKYLHLSSPSMTLFAVSLVMGAFFGLLAFLAAESLKSILLPTNTLMAEGTAL